MCSAWSLSGGCNLKLIKSPLLLISLKLISLFFSSVSFFFVFVLLWSGLFKRLNSVFLPANLIVVSLNDVALLNIIVAPLKQLATRF